MSDDFPIFGIDLGTTYSCIAAVVDDSEKVEVFQNSDSESITPSVVYFSSEKDSTVGKYAKAYAKIAPKLVCACVKRKMGDDTYRFEPYDKAYRAEQISALILRKVVQDAAQAKGYPADTRFRAVITVPAYFGSNAREATRIAGRLAGLEVVGLLPEPVAAAFAYGLSRAQREQHVLVYDLGGGTFDVTVVRVDGGSATCVATAGVRLLGGADWDEQIVKFANECFIAEHGSMGGEPKDDPMCAQRLLIDVEEAKKSLTNNDHAVLLVQHDGKTTTVKITRSEFEKRTESLIAQTIECTHEVIDAASLRGVKHIDKLLLVGGSSRMPVVKRRLKEEFGMDGEMYRPDWSVAEGAAFVAHLVKRGEYSFEPDPPEPPSDGVPGLPAVTASDNRPKLGFVTAKHLGIVALRKNGRGERELYVDYIIEQNAPIPLSRTSTYETVEPDQRYVDVEVKEEREEKSDVPNENETLHKAPLDLPPGLPEKTPIEVTFSLDTNGVLNVSAVEPQSKRRIDVRIEREGMLTEAKIAEMATVMRRINVS